MRLAAQQVMHMSNCSRHWSHAVCAAMHQRGSSNAHAIAMLSMHASWSYKCAEQARMDVNGRFTKSQDVHD